MLIKCQHCGAPLDVDPNDKVVTCRFCKAATKVEENPPPAPPQPQFAPPQPNFAPAPHYPPQPNFAPPRPNFAPPRRGQVRRKNSAGGCVVAGVVGIVGIGVAVMSLFGAGISAVSSSSGGPVSLSSGPRWWDSSSGTCLLDANGDGIFDVAGLSGDRGSGTTPTIVDGKNGDVIWMGEAAIKGSRSACVGHDWLVVSRPDFGLEFHRARQPEVPVKYMARDKLQGISLGKGCVNIKTNDGTTTGIALPGGTAMTCSAAKPRRLTEDRAGISGLTDDEATIARGAMTYHLRKRASGTKMLTVEVKKSGTTLWSKELPYASPTFGSAIAVGRGVVMVWAASPADTQKGMLVGLDEKTGTQKYEKKGSGRVSHSVEQFEFNGVYLITMYWGKVYAYKPKTGEIAWSSGS